MFAAATLVAVPIERKARKGTLFKFSLFSFAVAITLLGLAMAWGVRAYNGFLSERQRIHKVTQLQNEELLFSNVDYTDRFPRLISQLFNNGRTWWGDLPCFEKVKRVNVDIFLNVDEYTKEQLDRILEANRGTDFELEIQVYPFNNEAADYLEQFDECKIVSLDIDFDVDEWVEKKVGEDTYDLDWEEALKRADLEINLDLRLQHLENLTLSLTSDLPVKNQLEPFIGLPKLEHLSVSNVGEEAARFLLETREHWPEDADFELESEIPDELKREFEAAFPERDEEGGVF